MQTLRPSAPSLPARLEPLPVVARSRPHQQLAAAWTRRARGSSATWRRRPASVARASFRTLASSKCGTRRTRRLRRARRRGKTRVLRQFRPLGSEAEAEFLLLCCCYCFYLQSIPSPVYCSAFPQSYMCTRTLDLFQVYIDCSYSELS